jgi:hypothetical protein
LIEFIFQGEHHGANSSPYFGDTSRVNQLDMDKKSKFEELEYHQVTTHSPITACLYFDTFIALLSSKSLIGGMVNLIVW